MAACTGEAVPVFFRGSFTDCLDAVSLEISMALNKPTHKYIHLIVLRHKTIILVVFNSKGEQVFGRKVLKKTVERGNAYLCVIRSVRFRRLVGLSAWGRGSVMRASETRIRMGDIKMGLQGTNSCESGSRR